MSAAKLEETLKAVGTDDVTIRPLLAIWPLIEEILEAFARATSLPIFVYLNRTQVFHSSISEMSAFCCAMLTAPETASLCIENGSQRAIDVPPTDARGLQHCHAGLLNGRRVVGLAAGTEIAILFGARDDGGDAGRVIRAEFIASLKTADLDTLSALERHAAELRPNPISEAESSLMDAIAGIIRRLLSTTVEMQVLAINMAHEVSHSLLTLGLAVQDRSERLATPGESTLLATQDDGDSEMTEQHIYQECRLGLYVVRNFLSHLSEERVRQVAPLRFGTVDIASLLDEMLALHRPLANTKRIVFDCSGLGRLPRIRAVDLEIRRVFHNIISNAVKYSYRTTDNSPRVVRVSSRVPFDPGFNKPRFAVTFENYGTGLSDEESRSVFAPGFRGAQARREVPIGSGIGLSEAKKIMAIHGGSIRFNSKPLHAGTSGTTYLTKVDLIFPLASGAVSA